MPGLCDFTGRRLTDAVNGHAQRSVGIQMQVALNSFGVSWELDSSTYEIIVTRSRPIFRYQFGDNEEKLE